MGTSAHGCQSPMALFMWHGIIDTCTHGQTGTVCSLQMSDIIGLHNVTVTSWQNALVRLHIWCSRHKTVCEHIFIYMKSLMLVRFIPASLGRNTTVHIVCECVYVYVCDLVDQL